MKTFFENFLKPTPTLLRLRDYSKLLFNDLWKHLTVTSLTSTTTTLIWDFIYVE